MKNIPSTRRHFVRSSVFGMLAVSTSSMTYASKPGYSIGNFTNNGELFYRYPAIDDDRVSEMVGASHSKIDRVKELLRDRPELAKASWDWGFGDWESALGAASHVGRRDIAELLMSYGARPDIFTFAMLGALDAVEGMVAAAPGIQSKPGPHGITLLRHAQIRLMHKDLSTDDRKNVEKVVKYLESLGDANVTPKNLDISKEEQAIYIGDYRYGEKEDEVLVVDLNRRGYLQIARKGTFGRAMLRIDEHRFTPAGSATVEISFEVKDGKATSMTVHEPVPLVKAIRV